MEPSRVGPFSAPTVAALAALVVVWMAVSLLPSPSPLVTFAAAIAISAVLATEAYIRAMPTSGRRAFEAFSWLGEHELERARALTGSRVPTSRRGALRWLQDHPESPEIAGLRAEVLLLAGDVDAARATVERMPAATPAQRADREATRAVVAWIAGDDPDLDPLEASVRAIDPEDSDGRLRAEVSLAVARVRGRLGRGEAEPLVPLLDVRERLGRRADGQVGRALRKRMIPAFLVWGLAFGLILQVAAMLDRPLI